MKQIKPEIFFMIALDAFGSSICRLELLQLAEVILTIRSAHFGSFRFRPKIFVNLDAKLHCWGTSTNTSILCRVILLVAFMLWVVKSMETTDKSHYRQFRTELDSGRAFRIGPGSGRDFQIISDFFRDDMQHVNTKNFLLFFFLYSCCIFYLNLHSVASTRLDYFFFYFALMA